MEAHTHGFYQGTGAWVEFSGRDDLFPGQGDKLPHGTVALYAECLVVLAGVHTVVTAGGTLAAVGIGITGHHHPRL